ncbi:hypothetical protein EH240_21465 [Mesorhizobium tamadayense]|uniref:Uncharacterized protein n=1 Tax=Mesorhizobium tamadayense TaxID=425306 RepID=A0A3P3FF15_9HYPH|nr:hypothetical protein [Mesorhizobium tamadayense]RRH97199.1 hypothetical protein EH240_21465 [Mesorhizobium tamadayense]
MTYAEKYLYHQTQPLKLATDRAAGLGSLYALWQHQLLLGLLVMLVPPPIASFLIIRFVNLERQKQSAFGRYLARYMTRATEAVRLLGMIVMAIGAWLHSPAAMAAGLLVILFAWMRGLVFLG